MKLLPRVAALVIGLSSAGAIVPAADAADLSRGAELLAPFKQQLKLALAEGLAEGPVAAIDVCRIKAPAIGRGLAIDHIRVGRTSHRLRNPDNVAPGWAEPILQAWLEGENPEPRTVAIAEGREGYVEPIRLQPMCATCHGEFLAPDVREAIAAAYPEDRAIDFAVGDLRGLFWVEYPVD